MPAAGYCLEQHVSLKQFNTLGVDTTAARRVRVDQLQALPQALTAIAPQPLLVLGSGSNVLFTQPWDGAVLHINAAQMRVIRRDQTRVRVYAEAGLIWDDFVRQCTQSGFYGLENLTAIPGTVGAAPVQNIGA